MSNEQVMDLSDDSAEREWAKKVYIKNGFLVLNVKFLYEIELSRINTHAKLLHWILHLIQKNWVSRDMLFFMCHVLCDHFGWDYYAIGGVC